jgi:hypothetical protein
MDKVDAAMAINFLVGRRMDHHFLAEHRVRNATQVV